MRHCRLLLPQEFFQTGHGRQGKGTVCNALRLKDRDLHGPDLRKEPAARRQNHGNVKLFPVPEPQIVDQIPAGPADVAVGEDMQDPGHSDFCPPDFLLR